jgi:hypothetical protein
MAPKVRSARKRELRREQLWPGSASRIWPPQDGAGGWAKVSRILPVLLAVIDQSGMRKKNESVAQTYLDLLCRNLEEGLVEVPDEDEAALMSGFTGSRRIRSWHERVEALASLKLIEIQPVGARKIGAMLLLDPQAALLSLRGAGKVTNSLWSLVQKRYLETRGFDIGDPLKPPVGPAQVVPITRPRSIKRPAAEKP